MLKQFISTHEENVKVNNNIQKSIDVPRKYYSLFLEEKLCLQFLTADDCFFFFFFLTHEEQQKINKH